MGYKIAFLCCESILLYRENMDLVILLELFIFTEIRLLCICLYLQCYTSMH